MNQWKKKALEFFPNLQSEIQNDDTTIYNIFLELLPRCVQAHKDGNEGELKKIYDYAEWCHRQEEKELWNAAGVAFYEHLGNYPETRQEMHKWVKKDIFDEVAGLLEYMMGEKAFTELKKQFLVNF